MNFKYGLQSLFKGFLLFKYYVKCIEMDNFRNK